MINTFTQLAYLGPGGPEFLLIMLVLLVMFGAKDAPRILRKFNEIINQMRSTADNFKREVMYGDLNSQSNSDPAPFENMNDYDYDYGAECHDEDSHDPDDEAACEEMVEEPKKTPANVESESQEEDEDAR